MNFNDPASSSVSPEPASDATRPLRTLIHAIAIAVLILTGTLFVFIYRQVVLVRRQTTELVRYLVEYERSNASQFMVQMQREFQQYKNQHPDFTPIYLRYFGTNQPPAAAAGGAAPEKVTPLPPKAPR